tara:strand:- start:522 stop:1571 length:1050 start_codon:yes stop_codon:yes gene_type:complete
MFILERMITIILFGAISIGTAENLRSVDRRLLDVDHMSMDELEKLAANPDSLFGGNLQSAPTAQVIPMVPNNGRDVFSYGQLESLAKNPEESKHYDGFSYSSLENLASRASGHLPNSNPGTVQQSSLEKLKSLMKSLNGPSDIQKLVDNRDDLKDHILESEHIPLLRHPSPYNQETTQPYKRQNHPSTIAKAEKIASVNRNIKSATTATVLKQVIEKQLNERQPERQPEQRPETPVLRRARTVNKKYNKLWKTRDTSKAAFKASGTINPSQGWNVAHMLDADYSGTDDYTIAELKKIADISGIDTAWNPSISGSRHPWLSDRRHIREIAPKWNEMWEGFDTTPKILQKS